MCVRTVYTEVSDETNESLVSIGEKLLFPYLPEKPLEYSPSKKYITQVYNFLTL